MELQDEFKNGRLLESGEKIELNEALSEQKPRFMQKFFRVWYQRCLRRISVVADSSLDSEKAATDLSEFTTTYNELQSKIPGDQESTER